MDTAVVTGASRGVGAAVARRFAAREVHVVGCSRDGEDLEVVAADVASRATTPDGTSARAPSVRCGTASRIEANTPRTLTLSVSSNAE